MGLVYMPWYCEIMSRFHHFMGGLWVFVLVMCHVRLYYASVPPFYGSLRDFCFLCFCTFNVFYHGFNTLILVLRVMVDSTCLV